MKYPVSIVVLMFCVLAVRSQTYEIGGLVGGANYIGDIGSSRIVDPQKLAFGGIFRWNRSERHSFRLTAMYARIDDSDHRSNEPRRLDRDYNFRNSVKEASLGIEYTFWEFDLHTNEPQNAPYLYTGFTVFNHGELFLNEATGQIRRYDERWTFAIPMVVGYKLSIQRRFVLGFEVGARYTFTDNLDGSWPGDKGYPKFGAKPNDWYVFSGINFTVTFGRKPCYCDF